MTAVAVRLPDALPPAAQRLAAFAQDAALDRLPPAVLERAKALILDCVGIAYASSRSDFARSTLAALAALGSGESAVIGSPQRLALRDAMLANGLLVHGLDYDDTHMAGIIHASASCFPCALGVAGMTGAGGREMLGAYVLGLEVASRLSMVARGRLHQQGFHPTGLIAAFACALVAGRLLGLTPAQLVRAQGIALSLAAGGTQEFLSEGAWTKRLHPGWGAGAGTTAAFLARAGFVGPTLAYEGRYGLFRQYLGEGWDPAELDRQLATLGTSWETLQIAVKPFPVCHYSHACGDAALAIAREHRPPPAAIRAIEVELPAETHHIVAEPLDAKRRPKNDYEAKFSAPFLVATALARRRFGLAELDPAVWNDPEVQALADKVVCLEQRDSGFPKYFSGAVTVVLQDGRRLERREPVNRGAADRPLSPRELREKFDANVGGVLSPAAAEAVIAAVGRLEACAARDLGDLLSQPEGRS